MNPDYFDIAMRYVSEGLGRKKYHRAPIESVLCEGRFGRITLEIMEVYVNGTSLHLMSEHGGPLVKHFSTYTWIPVQLWKRECLYIVYIWPDY